MTPEKISQCFNIMMGIKNLISKVQVLDDIPIQPLGMGCIELHLVKENYKKIIIEPQFRTDENGEVYESCDWEKEWNILQSIEWDEEMKQAVRKVLVDKIESLCTELRHRGVDVPNDVFSRDHMFW